MKDHILLGKQSKGVEIAKAMNQSLIANGAGRRNDSLIDQVVLTRALNRPELIFNQKHWRDGDKKVRYFQKDAMHDWVLSNRGECYMCQKYKYTQIYYERGILSQNHELREIVDQDILDHLKYQFKKDYLKNRTSTPQISGTVVSRGSHHAAFERKLKMLRLPLYALLSILQCKDFTETKTQIEDIKEGIQKFLVYDSSEILDHLQVKESLFGWRHIINDMVNNNEILDVHTINIPDLTAYNIDRQDVFVFAGLLPPGYHQFLIYDPQLERAFCKDVVIKLSDRDFFPEYPTTSGAAFQKIVPNMWRQWIEASKEDLQTSFKADTATEDFQIHSYIKNPEEANNCQTYLCEHVYPVVIWQQEMLLTTAKYPRLDWESIIPALEAIQESEAYVPFTKLQRAQIELCYIGATSKAKTKGLKSTMQRSQLYDFLMRLCQAWVRAQYNSRESVAAHISQFFEVFIYPVVDASKIIARRKTIRASAKLNELLFDNHKDLLAIYEYAKNPEDDPTSGTFTLAESQEFFAELSEIGNLGLSSKQIQESYISSMMTNLQEHKSLQKYDHVTFWEFQEMVCRVAMVSPALDLDTIEFKVQRIIAVMHKMMVIKGVWQDG